MDNMKKVGENIGEELDHHKVLLDDLDKNVDKNVTKMEKASGRMDKLMKKSSNCCLFIIIFIEIVLLILMLKFL